MPRRFVTGLVTSLGALGVFLLMVPESACVPVPSELTLLFSGFAVHRGWMSLPEAIVAGTAGNVAGSLLAYALGASGVLRRRAAGRRLLARGESLLGEHETRAVFLARLMPLARTFVSLPAGARHVRLAPFVLVTAAGCGLWATLFVLAGDGAAGAWAAVDAVVGRVLLAAGVAIMAVLVLRSRHRG